jgi:WD40 repeat protein
LKIIIPKSKIHVLVLKISLVLTLIPILGGYNAFANSSYLDLPEPVACEYQGYEPEHKEEMHIGENSIIGGIRKNTYARLLFTESNKTEYALLIPMGNYPYSKSIWLNFSDTKEEISVHKPVKVIFNPPGERGIKNISALLPPESWQGYPSILVLYNDKKEERIYVAYRKGPGNDDIAWSIADATNFHIMFGDTIKLIAKVIIAPIAIPVFVVTLPLQIALGIAAYSKSPKEYEPHSYFNSVAFSPDGKYALSGNSDNAVKFWNIETGQNIRVFKGHSCEVESIAFSPNGKYALSGSMDKTIKLWDLDSGLLIRTFKGHARRVKSVAFSHDGRRVLSGSWDQTVKIWDVESGNEIRSFQKESSKFHKVHLSIYSIAISSNGLYALSGSSGTEVNLWEIESGRHIRTFLGHQYQDVKSVAFSPDGRYALSGGDYKDATMKLWEVSSGWEIGSIAQSGNVNSVAFSPDGRYALSCNDYGGLLLWELGTRSLIRRFEGHRGKVRSVAFSPDGRLILSGGEDESMKLWNVESGQEIRTFKAKTEETPRICGKVGDAF